MAPIGISEYILILDLKLKAKIIVADTNIPADKKIIKVCGFALPADNFFNTLYKVKKNTEVIAVKIQFINTITKQNFDFIIIALRITTFSV